MVNNIHTLHFELICVITNFGYGSKIIHVAKEYGISGGTILLGKGTVNNRVLDFLGLSDVRKEIIYMVSDEKTVYEALEKMNKKFEFEKPNHGIAFTTSITNALGTRSRRQDQITHERGIFNTMYQVITIIVEKGKAEGVIEVAAKAGSKGGTIMNGRGSGIHETSKLFSMDIEPEKEIIIILSQIEKVEHIINAIKEELKIDEPGNGIIYVQDVNKTYGVAK